MLLRSAALCIAAMASSACGSDRPLNIECRPFARFLTDITNEPPPDRVAATSNSLSELETTIASILPVRRGDEAAASVERSDANFLILSGGGQWGAFGAGFLQAWSGNRGTGPVRPAHFTMVTGVSTGALQATFAFLGEDYDQGLVDAYRITSERQLLRRHGPLFFLRHGSMADVRPLEGYVRARLRPMIGEVAAPENEGRKLYVGVVDALDGRMYAVDLTEMARELSGQEREDCYVAALLASAAVPVVFRQVTISGRPYLDGGVRQSVFVTEFQESIGNAAASKDLRGNIFVLMNGDITPSTVAQVKPQLLSTLNRLRGIVFNQIELSSVELAAARYPSMTTYIATAAGFDPDVPSDEEAEIFHPETMRRLIEFGRLRWEDGSGWDLYRSQ